MDLRQAAVGAASPLPRGRSSNIALADPNPAAGPAWGPSRWGAADVHPELLLCLLLALLLVHRPAQHMQRLSHASSSRGACASSLCAIMYLLVHLLLSRLNMGQRRVHVHDGTRNPNSNRNLSNILMALQVPLCRLKPAVLVGTGAASSNTQFAGPRCSYQHICTHLRGK